MNSGAVFGKYKNIFLFVLYLEVELLGDSGGVAYVQLGSIQFSKMVICFCILMNNVQVAIMYIFLNMTFSFSFLSFPFFLKKNCGKIAIIKKVPS